MKKRLLSMLLVLCMLPVGAISVSADETEEAAEEIYIDESAMEEWEAELGEYTETPANAYTPTEAKNLIGAQDEAHAYSPEINEDEDQAKPEFVEGEVLFARAEYGDIALLSADDALSDLGISGAEKIFESKKEQNGDIALAGVEESVVWYKADTSGDVEETVAALKEVDGIVNAEPNYIYKTTAEGLPEEADLNKNWFMKAANSEKGLNLHAGWKEAYRMNGLNPGSGAVVAVIDTGVDYNHEDLKANMWTNSGEIPDNNIDDDGNGYIDDYYGADTTANPRQDGKIAGNPMDNNGHGTHVAGIIAMADNKVGSVGIAYGAKIMAIKAGQSTGTLANSDIVEAVQYAVSMGADVINMSFGGGARSYLLEEALESAFATTVLVASAGNDGIPTTDAPPDFMYKADIYPAAYTYVLGVMASDSNGNKADFSNWDYINNANAEYEIIAPGADIYSTLPGNRYARWNGTSMAAPCVAAAAAVLRGCYPDKDEYSSRFIMGQLASASDVKTVYVDKNGEAHSYTRLNLYQSLTRLPEPNISVGEVFALDNTEQGENNDGDRIIDAGEVVDLGIAIRNQWGKTGEITVKADAISDGGVANSYVTFITDEITLEPAGTFATVDNGYMWEDSYLSAVSNPIRFEISPDTPNDTQIKINLTVTTTNGWDEKDTTIYTIEPKPSFTFRVQKGQSIRGHISEDTTLTSDKYWIIENSLVIDEGATLTVEPGTQIQFWSQDYEDAYNQKSIVYINNNGTLNMIGTEDEPIEMFPGAGFQNYAVQIYGDGVETLRYCEIINPYLGRGGSESRSLSKGKYFINLCDHCRLTQKYDEIKIRILSSGFMETVVASSVIADISFLSNTIVENIGHIYKVGNDLVREYIDESVSNLFINCAMIKLDTGYNNGVNIYSEKSVYIGGNEIHRDIQKINKLTTSPLELTSISEPFTYEGATSKYVHIKVGYSIEQYYDAIVDFVEEAGGHLVAFNDDTESAFISDYFHNYIESGRKAGNESLIQQYAYIGYNYDKDSDSWQWIDDPNNQYEWEVTSTTNIFESSSKRPATMTLFSKPTEYFTGKTNKSFADNAFFEFPVEMTDEDIIDALTEEEWEIAGQGFKNNAILNPVLNTDPDTWIKLYALNYGMVSARNIFWGTENDALINMMIIDDDDYPGTYSNIVETPILTLEDDLSEIYPFVTKVWLTEQGGDVEIEDAAPDKTYDVHVTYNRDMEQTVQPSVTYGGESPYTDYAVHGDWVSDREWVGTTKISSVATGGTMIFRTNGGCAADDNWLVCGADELRFQFNINSASALAMVLNATGGVNRVDLSWAQNDYEVLGGYNLYRSTKPDSGFKKINTSILAELEYTDTDVDPGVTYYYYFTVVNTDGVEVENTKSNTASATPLDNIRPTIVHTAVTSAKVGKDITISAKASDNIAVGGVDLYYRTAGEEVYNKKALTYNETTKVYTGTIPKSAVTAAGVEYYLEVYDNNGNREYSGSTTVPYAISTDSTPTILTATPSVINIGAEGRMTVYGTNFTEDMTVKLGGVEISEFELAADGTYFSFEAPALPIGSYALSITSGEKTVQLSSAVTYRDVASYVQINEGRVLSGEVLRLPLYVGLDGDLTAFYTEIKVPTANFSAAKAELADGVNASLNCNYSGGVLKISMANAQSFKPENETSPLLYLVLTPKTVAVSTEAHLTLTSGQLNGAETIESDTTTAVTILPNFTLNARVKYFKNNLAVPDVTIKVGDRLAVTDSTGAAAVTGISRADVTVIASKDEYTDAVDPFDGALILRSRVDLETLDASQQIAADVNGDGVVNEVDASLILQKSVMLIDTFPAGSWAFSPASVSTTLGSTSSSVSFTAIMIGDVNGSWKVTE